MLALILFLFLTVPEPIPPLPITPPVTIYIPFLKTETTIVFSKEIECIGDLYNCDDFATWNDAQLTFQYCMVQGLGDPYGLDRDADNFACENLPNPWR